MARIVSDAMFLQSLYSFGPMFTESVRTDFFNNQPFGYETLIPWKDSIETAYVAGRGTNFTTAFTGNALTISPRNIETGTLSGEVQGIFTYVGHRATTDLVHAASIWGISVSLREIQAVALTADQADDAALLRAMLSGDDVIQLGRFADKVNGFEGNDVIQTGGGSDLITGGLGNDRLVGHSGFDTLYGGVGGDTLIGGLQADELEGGNGSDVFIFDDGHTGLGIGARDIIRGWLTEDVLDFSRIDADTTRAGDQSFFFAFDTFEAMKPKAHAFWLIADGNDMIIRLETTGDKAHDMEVVIEGQARMVSLIDRDYGGTGEFRDIFVM